MSLISGSLFSYVALFSLAGSLTAAMAMWISRRAFGRRISAVGVSTLGAVSSNAIQILIARFVVFGASARLVAPAFLATGLVTGAALGFFAERFAAASAWYASISGKNNAA
jgi:heptaprenyl diphosphate synthase